MEKTTLRHPSSHKKATKKNAKKVYHFGKYITPRSPKSKGVLYILKEDFHLHSGEHIVKKASASKIRKSLKISSGYTKAASKIIKLSKIRLKERKT